MEVINQYQDKVSKLTNEKAAYLIGFLSIPAIPIVNYFSPFLGYWLSLGFFLTGIIAWLNASVKKFSSLLIARAVWGIVAISGTTLNLALASINVNSTLEVPSSPFIYTITITSVLLLPVTLSVLGIVLAIPLMLVASFSSVTKLSDLSPQKLLTLHFIKNGASRSLLLFFGRIIACVCLFSACITFNQSSAWYIEIIENKIKWVAYHLETESFSYCELGETERVAYLPNERVIIASKHLESFDFRVEICRTAL